MGRFVGALAMKNRLEFFVATIGWVLFVFVLIGVLHVAAVMESNALKLQDMRHERSEVLK
jgi:hypothetical protein